MLYNELETTVFKTMDTIKKLDLPEGITIDDLDNAFTFLYGRHSLNNSIYDSKSLNRACLTLLLMYHDKWHDYIQNFNSDFKTWYSTFDHSDGTENNDTTNNNNQNTSAYDSDILVPDSSNDSKGTSNNTTSKNSYRITQNSYQRYLTNLQDNVFKDIIFVDVRNILFKIIQ